MREPDCSLITPHLANLPIHTTAEHHSLYHLTHPLCLTLPLLLLFDLEQQRAIDVWQHSSKRDRRADQRVEFLIAANGELQMARRDTLDF